MSTTKINKMESLSKHRERRSNAGSRMAAMLDKEEDDFYKSTYGGFFEVCVYFVDCLVRRTN